MILSTSPIEEGFGVEVHDEDLSQIDDQLSEVILDLVNEHAFLLFRRQSLHDEDLVRLSESFGPLETPAKKSNRSPVEQILYLDELTNADGELFGNGISGGRDSGGWHSDQSFRAEPATLSTLFCVISPSVAGGTSFCSARMGYESLPADLKDRIADLRGLYRPGEDGLILENIEVEHSAVLQNPTNGRKSLYIAHRTLGFKGMDEESANALVEELLSYQLQEQHMYHHHWRMGDMLIYDNGQLLHRRDAGEGPRLLKGTRVFLSHERFAIP